MFLSRIALTNVRSMASLAIDFGAGTDAPAGTNRRWTLLLGENGCGKSSVLRAIGLLLAGSEALPELLGEADSWIRNGARSCRIAGTLVTAKGAPREIALELHRGDGLRQVFERNAPSLDALDAAIRHTDRNYFVLGYGVSRRPPETSARMSLPLDDAARSPRARALISLFSPDASLVSLPRWAMSLDYQRGEAALAPIRTALDQLMRGMNFSRIDKASGQLMFKTVDGEVPLNQLSDGYQNMAAWCGDLLYRITEAFPDRKDPLSTRGVLLIDELDLHLHPVWRRQLVDFLSTLLPNFQFVATTHSALTAQQSGEGELFVIRREGTKHRPVLVPFVGEPRLMGVHQLLMSPMFGLESMDSVVVEQARDTARKLHTKTSAKGKALTARERTRLQRSTDVLRAAPDWDMVPDYARQQMALIKDLKAAIAKQAAASAKSAKSVKPASPGAKAKATAAAKPAAKSAPKAPVTPRLSPTKIKAAVKRAERSK